MFWFGQGNKTRRTWKNDKILHGSSFQPYHIVVFGRDDNAGGLFWSRRAKVSPIFVVHQHDLRCTCVRACVFHVAALFIAFSLLWRSWCSFTHIRGENIDGNSSSIHLTSGCLQTFTATLYLTLLLCYGCYIDRTSDIRITIPWWPHSLVNSYVRGVQHSIDFTMMQQIWRRGLEMFFRYRPRNITIMLTF